MQRQRGADPEEPKMPTGCGKLRERTCFPPKYELASGKSGAVHTTQEFAPGVTSMSVRLTGRDVTVSSAVCVEPSTTKGTTNALNNSQPRPAPRDLARCCHIGSAMSDLRQLEHAAPLRESPYLVHVRSVRWRVFLMEVKHGGIRIAMCGCPAGFQFE